MEAFYDLSVSPPTHDLLNWLARVEAERVKRGEDSLQIRFVPGIRHRSNRDYFYTVEKRMWRIQNLLMPLAWLCPSVTDVSISLGVQNHSYLNPGRVCKPMLKAQNYALEVVRSWLPDNAVSITIRQSAFEEARNSNIHAWTVAGEWLRAKGYAPIIVPDAEADMEGQYTDMPFRHYRAASYCPELRLALYESCRMNCITNSGPMLMMLYGQCPMLAVKMEVAGIQCCARDYLTRSGFSPGHDWGRGKTMHWQDDTAENVINILETIL